MPISYGWDENDRVSSHFVSVTNAFVFVATFNRDGFFTNCNRNAFFTHSVRVDDLLSLSNCEFEPQLRFGSWQVYAKDILLCSLPVAHDVAYQHIPHPLSACVDLDLANDNITFEKVS